MSGWFWWQRWKWLSWGNQGLKVGCKCHSQAVWFGPKCVNMFLLLRHLQIQKVFLGYWFILHLQMDFSWLFQWHYYTHQYFQASHKWRLELLSKRTQCRLKACLYSKSVNVLQFKADRSRTQALTMNRWKLSFRLFGQRSFLKWLIW